MHKTEVLEWPPDPLGLEIDAEEDIATGRAAAGFVVAGCERECVVDRAGFEIADRWQDAWAIIMMVRMGPLGLIPCLEVLASATSRHPFRPCSLI